MGPSADKERGTEKEKKYHHTNREREREKMAAVNVEVGGGDEICEGQNQN